MRVWLHGPAQRSGETGFLTIEAVIAIALMALGAGTVMAAILAVWHQTAAGQPRAALTSSALNVLTDLRAATAYDGRQLAALAGGSIQFDLTEPAPSGSPQPRHIIAAIGAMTPGGAAVATVTVSDAHGGTVTLHSTLVQEAPAPGSVLSAGTLSPDAGTPPDAGPPTPEPLVVCRGGDALCGNPRAPLGR